MRGVLSLNFHVVLTGEQFDELIINACTSNLYVCILAELAGVGIEPRHAGKPQQDLASIHKLTIRQMADKRFGKHMTPRTYSAGSGIL